MKCPNCGNEVNPGQEFCGVCFQKIEHTNNNSIPEQANSVAEPVVQEVVPEVAPMQTPVVETPVVESAQAPAMPEQVTQPVEAVPVQPVQQPVETIPVQPVPTQPVEANNNIEEPKPLPDILGLNPNPTPQVEPTNNAEPKPTGNNKNIKVIIIAVIVILLIIGGCALYFGGKKGSKPSSNSSSNNSSNNQSSQHTNDNKESEKFECGLAGDHIHVNDLTDEEFKKLNIYASGASIFLYKDSKVKSLVYNGVTYSYSELIEIFTDFNKMTKFISDAADYTTGTNKSLTPEIVAYDITRSEGLLSYNAQASYGVLTSSERQLGKTSGGRKIGVQIFYPKGNYEKDGKHLIFNSTDYGKVSGSEIYFDYTLNTHAAAALSENCGIVLEDGRFVHALHKTSLFNITNPEYHLLSIFVYDSNYSVTQQGN